MVRSRDPALIHLALALLVTLALATAGWAHRVPLAASAAVSADIAVFVAGGGSLADLCGTKADDAAQRDHCPVCTLPGAVPQPATGQAARPILRTVVHVPPGPPLLPRAACHPAWNGRAPPVV